MEKQMLEMLKQMQSQMQIMDDRMVKMDDRMEKGFSEVNARLDHIDVKLDGIGGQFEETTKQIIALDDAGKTEMKFLAHKVNRLEKEVFLINNKQ